MTDMQRHLASWLTARSASDLACSPNRTNDVDFVRACGKAGVAGLVLERASRFDLPIPETARLGLTQCRMLVASRQANQTCELERLLQAMNSAAIPVMLLKGAALNLTLYKKSGLRPMSDIDLLVRPEMAGRALEVLLRSGCRAGYDLLRSDFFPTFHYERELITSGPQPVRIDLHARPFRPLRLSQTTPDEALWENARRIRVGRSEAWIPSTEVMLIHLAAHAAYHGFDRLLWLYDIKRLADANKDELDWSIVTDCAERWRLSLAVRTALLQVGEAFGFECPSETIHELASHRVTWRDRLALYQAPRDAQRPVAHILVNLLTTPGIRFKLGYVCALSFPDRAHLGGIYPFRHIAWPAFAHAWRALRTLGRVIRLPFQGMFHLIGRPLIS